METALSAVPLLSKGHDIAKQFGIALVTDALENAVLLKGWPA